MELGQTTPTSISSRTAVIGTPRSQRMIGMIVSFL
jgi:hypothetical protein